MLQGFGFPGILMFSICFLEFPFYCW